MGSQGLVPPICFTIALVALSCGCGGKDRAVPVEGVLTLDGQPVQGATITFLPEDVGRRPAHGLTLADGSFRLSTFQPDDGALPGSYKVLVHYNEPAGSPRDFKSEQGAMEALSKAPPKKKLPKYVIPADCGDPSKTPLRQKIPLDGRVRLELSSK